MKLFAIKTSLKLLVALLLALFCVGLGYAETPVPEGHLRITITNDTDILMFQHTYWLNHGDPGIGPRTVCGGEIRPGESSTFDRNMLSWGFTGTSIYFTEWSACRDYHNELEKYKSKVISKIPEGTSIVKIYHKHFELVPIVEDSSQK